MHYSILDTNPCLTEVKGTSEKLLCFDVTVARSEVQSHRCKEFAKADGKSESAGDFFFPLTLH